MTLPQMRAAALDCVDSLAGEELSLLLAAAENPVDRYWMDPAFILEEAFPSVDPWQARVMRSESPRLLLLCSRQAGKSTTAAGLALRTAILEPGSLTLLLSRTLRQSGELFRDKVLRNWKAIGSPLKAKAPTQLELTLANGSRIVSLPENEEGIRGYSGVGLLVIDEAARVSDELYKSVRPMVAVSAGRMVALSTPFGKTGWFYQEWFGDADWQRVRIAAANCPRIPADFLAEERKALGEEWYRQEYECDFSDGSGSPLFLSEWLARAAEVARSLRSTRRQAQAIGVDPGEGQANTCWAAVDEYGLIELVSERTPDTAVIPARTVTFAKRHGVPPDRWAFDAGGGGKQWAHVLRAQGYRGVRIVAFGEAVTPEPAPSQPFGRRFEAREERAAAVNRRAQMYGLLRDLLARESCWGIPAEYHELRRQLSLIPLQRDGEGRLKLPPKQRRGGSREGGERTLTEILGCSPDEADAVVLAVYSMTARASRPRAGTR